MINSIIVLSEEISNASEKKEDIPREEKPSERLRKNMTYKEIKQLLISYEFVFTRFANNAHPRFIKKTHNGKKVVVQVPTGHNKSSLSTSIIFGLRRELQNHGL